MNARRTRETHTHPSTTEPPGSGCFCPFAPLLSQFLCDRQVGAHRELQTLLRHQRDPLPLFAAGVLPAPACRSRTVVFLFSPSASLTPFSLYHRKEKLNTAVASPRVSVKCPLSMSSTWPCWLSPQTPSSFQHRPPWEPLPETPGELQHIVSQAAPPHSTEGEDR